MGFQTFCVSGIIYDFLLYKGIITDLTVEERAFGIGGKMVIVLCKTFQQNISSRVYFDNLPCTLVLLICLKRIKIDSLGSMRKNRLNGCSIEDETSIPKRRRGSNDFQMNTASFGSQ